MALVGVSVTKKVSFRDSVQEFSNVYHYTWAGLNPSASLAETILDDIKGREVGLHSTEVTFVRGRVWSAGGSPADNQMIFQKALTGTGSLTASTTLDRERAILIYWGAGFDSRGHPVNLRKWYHVCSGTVAGVTFGAGVQQNSSGFTQTQRDSIAALAAGFREPLINALTISLCGPTGRMNDGTAAKAHRYLEHHQLGDQWRGA